MLELIRPHDGPVTQPYGNTQADGYTDHATGQTFPNVYAAGDGVVLYAGDSRDLGWPNVYYLNPDFDRDDDVDSSAGNIVIIGHYGSSGGIEHVTGYGHLERVLVHEGDVVQAGDHIGITGQTGYSFGKHLHFFLMPVPYNYDTPTYGCIDPNPFMTEDPFMAHLNKEEQREMLGLLRTIPKMLDNIAGGINDIGGKVNLQTPEILEARDNARKLVESVIDGK
jgi:murein DD-endopeptidase MepM/ murein hydrolase activator NlpD